MVLAEIFTPWYTGQVIQGIAIEKSKANFTRAIIFMGLFSGGRLVWLLYKNWFCFLSFRCGQVSAHLSHAPICGVNLLHLVVTTLVISPPVQSLVLKTCAVAVTVKPYNWYRFLLWPCASYSMLIPSANWYIECWGWFWMLCFGLQKASQIFWVSRKPIW